MSAVFVTSSGTGIGKTLVAAALAHQLRAKGRRVTVLKPLMTGFDPASREPSDAAILLESIGAAVTGDAIAAVSPWRFRAPLSPDMAAAREGRAVDVEAVIAFCRREIAAGARVGSVVVIEGIGGVMVPLSTRRTVLDWIAALDIPVVLVVGSYLGSLSHTLTAAAALRMRNCELAGVVVSESADPAAPLSEVLAALAPHLDGTPALGIPRRDGASRPWRDAPDLTGFLERHG